VLRILAGALVFRARWEDAPRTRDALRKLLPYDGALIQARWSGEAAWVPMGDRTVVLDPERATSHPAPGELLLYTGTVSETEILVPYGTTVFSSKMGQLAGNHFATIVDGREQLRELGRRVLHEGEQRFRIEEAKD
jgi:hypothetical protein